MPEPQPNWQGWSEHDLEILRHHGKALGLQIQVPARVVREEAIERAGLGYRFTYTKPESKKETEVVKKVNNYTNHIMFILDASSSMSHLTDKVISVVDRQVAALAEQSKAMNQETRITIIVFADTAKCVVWDTDVLRAPSISEVYEPRGNTALVDATTMGLEDAATIPEKYGDHAHLIWVVTDGQENASGRSKANSNGFYWTTPPELIVKLKSMLTHLPNNVTVACMVPDRQGVDLAVRYGFPAGNVAIWDATSAHGLEEVGRVMRDTTSSYMQARATGTRSTTKLFDIGANVVNAQAIIDAGLKPLDYDDYKLIPVGVWPGQVKPADYDEKKRRKPWKAHGGRIDEFVQNVQRGEYEAGQAYYQLMEGTTVLIQASKKIAIVHKKTDRVYIGPGARELIGLPHDEAVRVKPSASYEYLVFVQSMAANRHLIPGSRLLVMSK